jgi:hypothetical protein
MACGVSSCTSALHPRRSRTTNRSAVPVDRRQAPRWFCFPATTTRTSGVISRRWHSRRNPWCSRSSTWTYDEPRYRKLDEARRREQQAMLDYQSTDDCRMVFLRAQLDEPELAEGALCGRCDNCAGARYSAGRRHDGCRLRPRPTAAARCRTGAAQAMAVRHEEAGRGRQWPDR